MKFLKALTWAAMHEEDFQQMQFFRPPRILIYSQWYHLEIHFVYPEIGYPIPYYIYERAGLEPKRLASASSDELEEVPF